MDVPSPAFDGVSDYDIDVYVQGDTQAPMAYDAWVTYDATKVHIAAPGTSTLIKLPGASYLGDALPDTDGMFIAGSVYLSGGPGIAGDGALVRLGLDIGGSGVVTFDFDPVSPATTYVSASQRAPHHPQDGPAGHQRGLPAGRAGGAGRARRRKRSRMQRSGARALEAA